MCSSALRYFSFSCSSSYLFTFWQSFSARVLYFFFGASLFSICACITLSLWKDMSFLKTLRIVHISPHARVRCKEQWPPVHHSSRLLIVQQFSYLSFFGTIPVFLKKILWQDLNPRPSDNRASVLPLSYCSYLSSHCWINQDYKILGPILGISLLGISLPWDQFFGISLPGISPPGINPPGISPPGISLPRTQPSHPLNPF